MQNVINFSVGEQAIILGIIIVFFCAGYLYRMLKDDDMIDELIDEKERERLEEKFDKNKERNTFGSVQPSCGDKKAGRKAYGNDRKAKSDSRPTRTGGKCAR